MKGTDSSLKVATTYLMRSTQDVVDVRMLAFSAKNFGSSEHYVCSCSAILIDGLDAHRDYVD